MNTSLSNQEPINRRALVDRHQPRLQQFDPKCPFTVGNGEFAFTADITGLQTFDDRYDPHIPLGTMAQWGWRSAPPPAGRTAADFEWTNLDTYGRPVPYPYTGSQMWFGVKSAYWPLDPVKEEVGGWLCNNPHRIHLGVLGFELKGNYGQQVAPDDLKNIDQTLDLWSGVIHSRFNIHDDPVYVRTACHPDLDLVAAEIESPLLAAGRQLAVRLAFPGANPYAAHAKDWLYPELHHTEVVSQTKEELVLKRSQDNSVYYVRLTWTYASLHQDGPHQFKLIPERGTKEMSVVLAFLKNLSSGGTTSVSSASPKADAVLAASTAHWAAFWQSGGAIELSGSCDSRANELERRIILSQYLTAIQCCGSTPPAETGLTCNSWGGKFHLEMHWWHAAHFAFWGRLPLLKRSLPWYRSILPQARLTAQRQGYQGARWPKQTATNGTESPCSIGPMLIWQQPHPLLYAEYCWRETPTREMLDEHAEVVEATADFMASYAHFDTTTGTYVLGPPLIPAQENHDPLITRNPVFELAYWAYGLGLAQTWRERMGLLRKAEWDDVIQRLAPLPVQDGVYLAHENCPETYTKFNIDHPSMLCAYGMIPGPNVDRETMSQTLDRVMTEWRWDQTWGWDYPLAAMTAARLGRPAQALDLLMMESRGNGYAVNGHSFQFEGLPFYLPANGGLLAAVAMMAAGWDGGPSTNAPGFPADGSWQVRWEGLRKVP